MLRSTFSRSACNPVSVVRSIPSITRDTSTNPVHRAGAVVTLDSVVEVVGMIVETAVDAVLVDADVDVTASVLAAAELSALGLVEVGVV